MTINASPTMYRTLALRQKPDVVTIGGERRYVFSNGTSSELGPVSHRRRRTMFTGKRTETSQSHDTHPHLEGVGTTLGGITESLQAFQQQMKSAFPPAPRRAWPVRAARKVRDVLTDKHKHEVFQHFMFDAFMLALGTTSVSTGVKLFVWMWL